MKYAVEKGSGAMTHIPNFIKTGSGIQKLMAGGGFHKHIETWISHKPTLIFSK
jgi:hypothetical protein